MTESRDEGVRVLVACSDCDFETLVSRSANTNPADYIISHGRETGHTLTVTTIDD